MQALFTRSRTPGAVLLRLVCWSQWSHCGLVTEAGTVIEARAFVGVVETPIVEAMEIASHSELVDIECPDPAAAESFARAQLGKSYDWRGVIGLGLHREWERQDFWWCSELLEASLAAGGRARFRQRLLKRITQQHSYMVV